MPIEDDIKERAFLVVLRGVESVVRASVSRINVGGRA